MDRPPASFRTERLRAPEPADVARAAALLRAGRLVAFPTETVYGLGANALDAAAVAGIFHAKGRPAWDPLIVHLAAPTQLAEVATVPAEHAAVVQALLGRFWPGPLTLLLPRKPCVPDAVTAGRALVGVRVPAHPVARALLAGAGVPVAAPSANRFGHTSPTAAAHVLDDLDGRIDAVLDGGSCGVGVESTVAGFGAAGLEVYRPGAVTLEMLRAVAGSEVRLYVPLARGADDVTALPSPGVGIRHYAPRARLLLVEGKEALAAAAPGAGVLLPDGWVAPGARAVYPWGAWDDPEALARELFAGLRALDAAGVATIVCPFPAEGGLGLALLDRLHKAARD